MNIKLFITWNITSRCFRKLCKLERDLNTPLNSQVSYIYFEGLELENKSIFKQISLYFECKRELLKGVNND